VCWQIFLPEMHSIRLHRQGKVESVVHDEKGSVLAAEAPNEQSLIVQVPEISLLVPKLDHRGPALEGLLRHLVVSEPREGLVGDHTQEIWKGHSVKSGNCYVPQGRNNTEELETVGRVS
jgi:hypothetical protein